ncbi:MAG: D-alanyl-D-alanine carboxypeptidase [Firmicutes bacterium]|nr:D-alanyl-D-alanine carboxypeptidase [Bacillota bacterium]
MRTGGWRTLFLVAPILWMDLPASAPVRAAGPPPPVVGARAAILIDARTGAVLYAKHAFRQMDPASLTKMMTAILVIRRGGLDRVVTISRRAAATGGSRLHIRAGQRYTIEHLLRGLLLRSGNDAAVALAEAEAGSVRRFVAEMNLEAQRLGAFNTDFANPNGLTAPGHYSSAYDLALIARYAMTLPVFRAIVRQQELPVQEAGGATRHIRNTNQLLYGFPGAVGIKTGTTSAAGPCLAAAAVRRGRELISVVLDSRDRWGDSTRLLNWGFRYWRTLTVLRRGQPVGQGVVGVSGGVAPLVPVVAGRSLDLTVPAGTVLRCVPALSRPQAPVRAGEAVGRVEVWWDGLPQASVPVVAARADPRPAPAGRFWQWWRRFLGWFNAGDGAG